MHARIPRIIASLLILLFAIQGASCSKPDGPRKLIFAGVPKLQNNPVFEVARRGATAKAAELNIELRWQAPREADAIQQRDIVYSQIEQHVDGIFISVNDPTVLGKAIDDAAAAGIPVMCFDADAPGSARFTCFSVDDEKAGARGAELLVEKMGTEGKVGILHGTPGAPNLEKRIQGFRRRLGELAPKITILAPVYCNDNTQRAIEVVKNVIQGNPDLTGFYMSGGWPLFAAPPGPFLGMDPGKITVVSFDALPEQLDYVRQGYVHALTGQKLREWGSESIRILKEWKDGRREFPKFMDSGFDVVKKDNVEAYAAGNSSR